MDARDICLYLVLSLLIFISPTFAQTVSYDGSVVRLNVNGTDLADLIPTVNSTGTVGYEVKNTTASFDSICIR